MPFKLTEETRQVTKKFGKQSLTLSYYQFKGGAAEQTRFLDDLRAINRKCPACGMKLDMEEVPESERDVKKKSSSNGHVGVERAVVCGACGENTRPLERMAKHVAAWLGENLAEADWEDDKGMIPLEEQALFERIPFDLMMTAFTMVREDKEGKD